MQVTKLNEGLVNGRAYSKTEIIHWKGANDETVEGILYYPTNYEEGKKYPLITAIHGGPQGSDKDLWGESWAYPIQLLTQRGSFVLRPELSRQQQLRTEVVGVDLLRQVLRSGNARHQRRRRLSDRQRYGRRRQDRDHGLVERIDSLHEPDHHVSRTLQSRQRRRGRRRVDQRLGQCLFRRIVRRVLFRQIADAGSAAVHQQIAVLQNGQSAGAGADFPRHRRHQRSSGAKLVLFPRAAVLRQGAGEIRGVPRRATRPAQADAPDAQSRGRSRVVRQIFLQDREDRTTKR